jgi:hypothetical protein
MKGLLMLIAIIGSLFGYTVVNMFIIEMSIGKFLLIELIISLLHLLYNCAKRVELLNRIKSK